MLRVQRVAGATCCERSNVHQATRRKQSSLVGGGIPICMSRRVQCVVLGPCTRAGRPMNMGRMCYVLCWALHTCRSTYEYGSYVLCVVLAPAYIRAGRPMNMGRMCYVFEAPAVSRRDDL